MNRVLKRPMFRLGGSAEGITSGLDEPNINASRQGYDPGGVVHPLEKKSTYDVIGEDELVYTGGTGINSINTRKEGGDTSARGTDKSQNVRDAIAMSESLYDEYGVNPEKERGAPGSVSSMLMNFGLNLAGQPGGDLVGAIGRAGSPALQKFQESRQLERLRKSKDKKEMIDSLVRSEYGLEEERIAAQGAIDEALIESQGTGEKAFQFQAQFKQITDTRQKIRDLQKEVDAGNDPGGSKEAKIADLNEALTDLVGINPILEAIYSSDWMSEQIDAITDDFEAEHGKQPSIDEVLKIIKSKGKKDGGRIGYQIGGEVEEITGSVDTVAGPDQTQDLTYMELRNRLPREISNDIVQLLSASKQALTDFANIQTQQDVDNFNQSYNVDLVLPQEG